MTKLFGTNGIRGVVNENMNGLLALNIGKAWGSHLLVKKKTPSIAIGTDVRLSGDMLKSAVTAGLLSTGCNVEDIGILPTPTLQYAVKTRAYDSGVVITASHNPPQFNGIKGIAADGIEFDKATEGAIEARYFADNYAIASWREIGQYSCWNGAISAHLNGIFEKVDVLSIKKQAFKVVLDCGNGAGSVIAPYLLKKLGCTVTKINCTLDGRFPSRPSEPLMENVTELINTVKKEQPVCGVALDGDADRAIFIDNNGRYLMGDISLTLLGKYIAQKNPRGLLLTPVTTSTVFEEVIKQTGGLVDYTRVGSPIVAREMIRTKAVFGGEENGGQIFPQLQYCRDALMTIAKMLEVLATEQQSLSDMASSLPHYSMVKSKIACPNEMKNMALTKIIEAINESHGLKKIDRTDGLKLFVENGWVLLRPSGTEPIFRIYAESDTAKNAQNLVSIYTAIIQNIIQENEE
jgi:phosphomannomutase/phosphoglucomutase